MNRKLISLTMAMLLLCAMALNACGKKETPETTQAATEPAATTQAALEELGLTTWSLSASTWSSPNGATIHLTATPNRHLDGESADFVIRLEDETVETIACTWEDDNYVADADLNTADGYCYYVVLNGADGTSTEVAVNTPAEPINEDYINLKSALEAYCSLTLGESALENGKLVISSGAATVQAPRITDAGQEVGCTKATLILTLDGQELATKELTMAPGDTAKSYECALDDVSFDLPATLGAEQRLTLRLDAELSNGQKLTAEGVTWYYQDGNLANAVG